MASKAGMGTIASRYATAFLELAEANGALDNVALDLENLMNMFAESDDLRRMIANPLLSRTDQVNAAVAICEKAEFSDLTRKFVGMVAENRRLPALSEMIRAIRAEIARRRGEVTAVVTSATALSAKQEKALTDSLKTALSSDVTLDLRVEPNILGGLIVQVGSRMVDNSVRTKLERLHRAMKNQTTANEDAQMREVA